MTPIPRCTFCNGSVLAKQCILCGRSFEPDTVSLGEALLDNMRPVWDREDDQSAKAASRQRAPLSVSLARAAAWGRGERAQ